jgi:ribosomal 30S subunit maturation factor RimM
MVEILHRRTGSFYNETIKVKNLSDKSQKNLASLQSLITPNQKKKIVKKIFRNDEKAYDDFIQQLEAINNWQEAWQMIEAELNKRNIEAHEPNSVFFTDILYCRYFPENAKC